VAQMRVSCQRLECLVDLVHEAFGRLNVPLGDEGCGGVDIVKRYWENS
jgi:hypothetical protein